MAFLGLEVKCLGKRRFWDGGGGGRSDEPKGSDRRSVRESFKLALKIVHCLEGMGVHFLRGQVGLKWVRLRAVAFRRFSACRCWQWCQIERDGCVHQR